MDKTEKALEMFRGSYNCAQAVVAAHAEAMGYNESQALAAAAGFGAGMGRLQETCGAVTGAFMVLGFPVVRQIADPAARKEQIIKMVQDFNARFSAMNGTTNCRELLNCDLNTEEGRAMQIEKGLRTSVCEKCIRDAVAILDDMGCMAGQ